MGKIITHIANSNQYFSSDDITIIENATNAAEEYISGIFNFDFDVDLMIVAPSQLISTIPEDGIGARTYSSRLIIICIDKDQAIIKQDTVFETICHEMSHSMRWEKLPEHANTLFDGMILEGLAVLLEEKALLDTGRQSKQFFLQEVQNTGKEQIDSMTGILKNDFFSEVYDYQTVFFTGKDNLPRWAGYKLGYYFTKKYLAEKQISVEEATTQSYLDFRIKV